MTNRRKQEVSYYDEDDDQVDVAPIVHPDLAAEIPGVERALPEDGVVPMIVEDRRAAAAAVLRHRSLSTRPPHLRGSAYPISDDEHSAREHADDDDDSAYLTSPDTEGDEDLDSEGAESKDDSYADESSEDEESEDEESEDEASEDEDSIHDNSDDASEEEEINDGDEDAEIAGVQEPDAETTGNNSTAEGSGTTRKGAKGDRCSTFLR